MSVQRTLNPITQRILVGHEMSPLNNDMKVQALEPIGAGGAYSLYRIEHIHSGNPRMKPIEIKFQEGGFANPNMPADSEVNGTTDEVLLAIVEHRLACFQEGRFGCRENAVALTKVQEALLWLHQRTRSRMARGVEGKVEV